MCDVTLMNILDGLVSNYPKFNLTNKNNKFEILNMELNYIATVGEVLGYSSTIIGINENEKTINGTIEINWKEYNKNSTDIKTILYFSRELDLIQDTNAVYKLINVINTQIQTKAFIQIIDIPFEGRIDYLNKILKNCNRLKHVEVLIIYNIYNIKEGSRDYYAYLFKESNLIKQKNAHLYYDSLGVMKMKFI